MLHFSLNRSDKLRLSVLDLTHTDLATEEDKKYQLDYWASLFKSTTWEELKMLAQNNEYIEQASETIYQLSQEEAIRQQCEAREDYYRRENGKKAEMEAKDNTIKEQQAIIDRLSDENTSLKNDLTSAQNEIKILQNELNTQKNELNSFKTLMAPLIDQANLKNDLDK